MHPASEPRPPQAAAPAFARTVGDPPPDRIQTESELDEWLTRPTPALIEFIPHLRSPLLVLGAGGKMGPTLAVLAARAAAAAGHRLEIVAVSRFSDPDARAWLEAHGVQTHAADLLDRAAVAQLPVARDLIYLVGLKFGTARDPALTWVVNTLVPAHVVERFPGTRMVALSTGNVYPNLPTSGPGASEDHPLTPLGEYANAAVARERVFEYLARQHHVQLALLRLSYAVELRYGVFADMAARIWAGETIDLANGWLNWIWQRDANDCILRALALAATPATAWNLTGPSPVRVRTVAEALARALDRPALTVGEESGTALLSNAARLCAALGPPPTPLEPVVRWTADWVRHGGRSLNRPTHFEVRDGRY